VFLKVTEIFIASPCYRLTVKPALAVVRKGKSYIYMNGKSQLVFYSFPSFIIAQKIKA